MLVAHHFPPAGGSGANRALAMATFLREYGWEPTVLTVGSPWAISRDESSLAEVPAGLRVVRTRSFEPRPRALGAGPVPERRPDLRARRPVESIAPRVAAQARRHVGHLKRFPDGHAGWIPYAWAAALRQPCDAIYTTSGPFSSHVVGLLVALSRRTPWVAELRDGWYRWNRAIFPDYPAWRGLAEGRLESAAIHRAERVVLVTERMAEAFRRQYADLPRDHFVCVPNGFLPRDVARAAELDRPNADGMLTLLHAGALYYGRSVAALLAAMRRLIDTDAELGALLRLDLVGTLDSGVDAEVRASGLSEHVRVLGQVDHAVALAAMRNADLLLLVANTTSGAEATVPGKLFEYLVSGRPVVALAPDPSSTRDVLASTGGAYLARPDDVDAIASTLRRVLMDVRANRASRPDADAVAQFDRRRLAGEMARILDHAVETKTHARRI